MRIDQALTNLLSNAVRYGAGKPIEIVATTSEGEITIAVKDQGPGIPEDDRKRIFERFERGHEHTSGIGLGLGLWITQRIAEAHGGTLRVESEVGRGSTFTLALPLQSQ
jgi:signal transduction histidine kinase